MALDVINAFNISLSLVFMQWQVIYYFESKIHDLILSPSLSSGLIFSPSLFLNPMYYWRLVSVLFSHSSLSPSPGQKIISGRSLSFSVFYFLYKVIPWQK